MSLKLMYITNNKIIAKIAEECGVERIWVDLEKRGKEERQAGMNTVKSNHVPEDINKLKACVERSELLVRVNPLWEDSKKEIDDVIRRGADIVMLPMFRTAKEAEMFVNYVGGRAKTMLLLETREAYEHIDEILKVRGTDEIHIGLNDLHLAYGMTFMFELLANGQVEYLCRKIAAAKISYGFGGIARINEGILPGKNVVAEHYRLGSNMAILSRTFCDTWTDQNEERVRKQFCEGISELRAYEIKLKSADERFFLKNSDEVKRKVKVIVENIREKRGA